MKDVETFGPYGNRLIGAAGSQLLFVAGTPYRVDYAFEDWRDPLGTLEVTEVLAVVDAYGTGTIRCDEVEGEAGEVAWRAAERAFLSFFGSVVRAAMR